MKEKGKKLTRVCGNASRICVTGGIVDLCHLAHFLFAVLLIPCSFEIITRRAVAMVITLKIQSKSWFQ